MFCGNCGASVDDQNNFCPYCGNRLANATVTSTLLNKAVYTAQAENRYSLVLVSRGTCDAVTAGDLLEDVFGYTDAESGNLVRMAPVVVGENLTSEEAATVAQLYTEYGMQVSVTDERDQYVDLSDKAVSSVFDFSGNLLSGAAAVISALTVGNRISSYRRFKKPSLLERLFHINYKPARPEMHRRNFRPQLDPKPMEPRKTIRRPVQMNGVHGGMHPAPAGSGLRQAPGGMRQEPRTGGMHQEPANGGIRQKSASIGRGSGMNGPDHGGRGPKGGNR